MSRSALVSLLCAALASSALLSAGCTRLHTFRLDRIENKILVTSSSMEKGTYEPIAFLKVSRWRVDPGSMFKRDYESPVGYQLLNDHLVTKAEALGADAIIDVETKYAGGVLFARATATGMAVKLIETKKARAHSAAGHGPPDRLAAPGAHAPRRGLHLRDALTRRSG